MPELSKRSYGPLSTPTRQIPSTPPSRLITPSSDRRAFSLPDMPIRISFPSVLGPSSSSPSSSRGSSSRPVLPLSSYSRSGSPPSPGRTAKRLSYTLRNRLGHNKVRVILAALLLSIFLIWSNGRRHSLNVRSGGRMQTRNVQNVFGLGRKGAGGRQKGTNGVSFLDDTETDEWLAEDDLFFSQYEEDEPLSAQEELEQEQVATRKADVAERNRQQSLQALVWWIAEGGEIPDDWTAPSKAYLKKVGGRGMERILQDIDDERDGEVVFEQGWAEAAKKQYRIIVFSKTFCPYSRKAKDVLGKYELATQPYIVELDERSDGPQMQDLLEQLTGRRTVPNIIFDFVPFGGSDDLTLAHSEGSLKRRFEDLKLLSDPTRFWQPHVVQPQIPAMQQQQPGQQQPPIVQPVQPVHPIGGDNGLGVPVAPGLKPVIEAAEPKILHFDGMAQPGIPGVPAAPPGGPGAKGAGVAAGVDRMQADKHVIANPDQVGHKPDAPGAALAIPQVVKQVAGGRPEDEDEEEEEEEEEEAEDEDTPDSVVQQAPIRKGDDPAAIRAALEAARANAQLDANSEDEDEDDTAHAAAREPFRGAARGGADAAAGAVEAAKARKQEIADKVKQNQVKIRKGQQPWDEVEHVKSPGKGGVPGLEEVGDVRNRLKLGDGDAVKDLDDRGREFDKVDRNVLGQGAPAGQPGQPGPPPNGFPINAAGGGKGMMMPAGPAADDNARAQNAGGGKGMKQGGAGEALDRANAGPKPVGKARLPIQDEDDVDTDHAPPRDPHVKLPPPGGKQAVNDKAAHPADQPPPRDNRIPQGHQGDGAGAAVAPKAQQVKADKFLDRANANQEKKKNAIEAAKERKKAAAAAGDPAGEDAKAAAAEKGDGQANANANGGAQKIQKAGAGQIHKDPTDETKPVVQGKGAGATKPKKGKAKAKGKGGAAKAKAKVGMAKTPQDKMKGQPIRDDEDTVAPAAADGAGEKNAKAPAREAIVPIKKEMTAAEKKAAIAEAVRRGSKAKGKQAGGRRKGKVLVR